jgi:hypothetical protein
MTKVSFGGGNLGDALWLTPLARYIPNLTVQLRKGDKRAAAVSSIFDGLCKVEFIENPESPNKSKLDVHSAQKILYAYNIIDRNAIPAIKLKDEEISWAKEYLKNHSNPIAIINNNSGTNDPLNYRAKYVCPPHEYIQEIADHYRKNGKTVLQFGPLSDYYDHDPFVPIDGAIQIRGLSARQLAACYHVIGQMISGDTGDYHLMLAVGGKCVTLVPHENFQLGYIYSDLLYGYAADDWKGEPVRAMYLNHEDYKDIIINKVFLP